MAEAKQLLRELDQGQLRSLETCFGADKLLATVDLYLLSRAGDAETTLERLRATVEIIDQYGLQALTETEEIKSVLRLDIFQMAPEQKNQEGNPVVVMRAHRLEFDKITPTSFLKAWFYTLWHNVILANQMAQTSGVVMCGDVSLIGRKNFKPQVQRFLAKAIQKCLPIKIKNFFIYKPPWVFTNVIFPFMRLIINQKLQERIVIITSSDFSTQPPEFQQYERFFLNQ